MCRLTQEARVIEQSSVLDAIIFHIDSSSSKDAILRCVRHPDQSVSWAFHSITSIGDQMTPVVGLTGSIEDVVNNALYQFGYRLFDHVPSYASYRDAHFPQHLIL